MLRTSQQKDSRGARVADGVVRQMGSWRFIIWQTLIVLLWITINVLAFFPHADPYPFILLNLLFSTQAAYASPIILMASNRQARITAVAEDARQTQHEEQLGRVEQLEATVDTHVAHLDAKLDTLLAKLEESRRAETSTTPDNA